MGSPGMGAGSYAGRPRGAAPRHGATASRQHTFAEGMLRHESVPPGQSAHNGGCQLGLQSCQVGIVKAQQPNALISSLQARTGRQGWRQGGRRNTASCGSRERWGGGEGGAASRAELCGAGGPGRAALAVHGGGAHSRRAVPTHPHRAPPRGSPPGRPTKPFPAQRCAGRPLPPRASPC